MFDHAVILAGGVGNRLWPVSTAARPKYLLEIKRSRSLLRDTLLRADAIARSTIVIVTHHTHIRQIVSQLRACSLPDKEVVVLLEPEVRNTAPAIALAVSYLNSRGAGQSVLCMPADHLIHPLSRFVDDASSACEAVGQNHVVVFGIAPHTVNTGYGHIEIGDRLAHGYAIKKFHEKPDYATAQSYLQSGGRFFWNSGLYGFTTTLLWSELSAYEPSITVRLSAHELFHFERDGNISVQQMTAPLRAAYRDMPAVAIDYAVAERSKRVAMIAARFQWDDIGSWDEICRLIDEGRIDPPAEGMALVHNGQNNTIISDSTVAICGLNDIIVVVQDGVVLVCRKGSSQDVKSVALTYGERTKRTTDGAAAT